MPYLTSQSNIAAAHHTGTTAAIAQALRGPTPAGPTTGPGASYGNMGNAGGVTSNGGRGPSAPAGNSNGMGNSGTATRWGGAQLSPSQGMGMGNSATNPTHGFGLPGGMGVTAIRPYGYNRAMGLQHPLANPGYGYGIMGGYDESGVDPGVFGTDPNIYNTGFRASPPRGNNPFSQPQSGTSSPWGGGRPVQQPQVIDSWYFKQPAPTPGSGTSTAWGGGPPGTSAADAAMANHPMASNDQRRSIKPNRNTTVAYKNSDWPSPQGGPSQVASNSPVASPSWGLQGGAGIPDFSSYTSGSPPGQIASIDPVPFDPASYPGDNMGGADQNPGASPGSGGGGRVAQILHALGATTPFESASPSQQGVPLTAADRANWVRQHADMNGNTYASRDGSSPTATDSTGTSTAPVIVQAGPAFSWVQWAPGQPPQKVSNLVLQGMA